MTSNFSFSSHRSQTVMATISVSPLAILALETSSFALFGQLCILYAPPEILLQMLSSHPIKVWFKAQYSQCKVSRPVPQCRRGRGEVVWGRTVYRWPTEHAFHAHQSESTGFKWSTEPPPAHAGFRSRSIDGYSKLLSILKVLFHAQNCLAFIIPCQVLDFEQNCMKIYLTAVNCAVLPQTPDQACVVSLPTWDSCWWTDGTNQVKLRTQATSTLCIAEPRGIRVRTLWISSVTLQLAFQMQKSDKAA